MKNQKVLDAIAEEDGEIAIDKISVKDLALRTRQYLDGEISRGVLEAILGPIEQDMQRRDKHD